MVLTETFYSQFLIIKVVFYYAPEAENVLYYTKWITVKKNI